MLFTQMPWSLQWAGVSGHPLSLSLVISMKGGVKKNYFNVSEIRCVCSLVWLQLHLVGLLWNDRREIESYNTLLGTVVENGLWKSEGIVHSDEFVCVY